MNAKSVKTEYSICAAGCFCDDADRCIDDSCRLCHGWGADLRKAGAQPYGAVLYPLICGLEEGGTVDGVEHAHEDEDACYAQPAYTSQGHTHGACIQPQCGLEAHTHKEECYKAVAVCTCDAKPDEEGAVSHEKGCELYVAVCTCGAELDGEGTVAHTKECELYVPACTCNAEPGEDGTVIHKKGCEVYVAPVCICQTPCSEEARNAERPVCGVEGALLTGCDIYMAKTVEGRIRRIFRPDGEAKAGRGSCPGSQFGKPLAGVGEF